MAKKAYIGVPTTVYTETWTGAASSQSEFSALGAGSYDAVVVEAGDNYPYNGSAASFDAVLDDLLERHDPYSAYINVYYYPDADGGDVRYTYQSTFRADVISESYIKSNKTLVDNGEKEEVARENKKGYIGVDGAARKLKKSYIGVNGVARLFYQHVPTFYVQENAYQFEEGMTWREFVNSNYNTSGFWIEQVWAELVMYDNDYFILETEYMVDDYIKDGKTYTLEYFTP